MQCNKENIHAMQRSKSVYDARWLKGITAVTIRYHRGDAGEKESDEEGIPGSLRRWNQSLDEEWDHIEWWRQVKGIWLKGEPSHSFPHLASLTHQSANNTYFETRFWFDPSTTYFWSKGNPFDSISVGRQELSSHFKWTFLDALASLELVIRVTHWPIIFSQDIRSIGY